MKFELLPAGKEGQLFFKLTAEDNADGAVLSRLWEGVVRVCVYQREHPGKGPGVGDTVEIICRDKPDV